MFKKLVFVLALAVVASRQVDASCALRQDTGVLCDTACSDFNGDLTCFDLSPGRCCYESENACGDTVSCSECQGASCTPGGF